MRYGVKAYVPPARMQEIAAERTECLRDAYMDMARRAHNFPSQLQALETLIRSAYMQGCNDCAEALAQTCDVIPKGAEKGGMG